MTGDELIAHHRRIRERLARERARAEGNDQARAFFEGYKRDRARRDAERDQERQATAGFENAIECRFLAAFKIWVPADEQACQQLELEFPK